MTTMKDLARLTLTLTILYAGPLAIIGWILHR